jgi:hypothetical protein
MRRTAAGIAVVALIAIGAIVALGGGASEESLEFSVFEAKNSCAPVFLAEPAAAEYLKQAPPKNWKVIQEDPHATFANAVYAGVEIEGGAGPSITLQGIDFDVERMTRPPGSIVYPGCLDFPEGPAIEAEFSPGGKPQLLGSPFPLKLPLGEPRTFYVVVRTVRCHCDWTATIPWRSGSEHGVLKIADGKKPFQVTFTSGLQVDVARETDWYRLAG